MKNKLLLMAFLLSILVVLFFCFAPTSSSKISEKIAPSTVYGASTVSFRNVDFYLYHVNENEQIKLWLKDDNDNIYKNIGNLKKDLEQKGEELVFAMNAGMYTKENLPQGLYKSNGQELAPIDTVTKGYGNFYLQPNGVFAFDADKATIETTQNYLKVKSLYKNVTQSGPMLVINGKMHPKFNKNSSSKYIRNGVGINDVGEVIFAFSAVPVNFYHFADLFLSVLKCDNALYLDGAISKIYSPTLERVDTIGNLGPLVGISKNQ